MTSTYTTSFTGANGAVSQSTVTTNIPVATQSSNGLSRSDQIALGVGIGIGIPTVVTGFLALYYTYKASKEGKRLSRGHSIVTVTGPTTIQT